jgi:hypothetical protein
MKKLILKKKNEKFNLFKREKKKKVNFLVSSIEKYKFGFVKKKKFKFGFIFFIYFENLF